MLQKSYEEGNAVVTHLLCLSYSERYQGRMQMCVLGYYLDYFFSDYEDDFMSWNIYIFLIPK